MENLTERCIARLQQGLKHEPRQLHELDQTIRRERIMEIMPGTELFLRPGLLTSAQRAELGRDMVALFDLLVALPDRLFGGDAGRLCDLIGFSSLEKQAVLATWKDQAVMIGRADLFCDTTGFKLLEFNVHSSTAGLENADLNRAMLDTALFRQMVQEERLTYTDTIDGIAAAMRAAADQRGLGERPTVAVLEWHSAFEKFEQSMQRICHLLQARGFEAFACHTRQVSLRDNVLYVGERPVDILYRIFLINDLDESPADIAPILQAHQAGNLLLAMGFVAELVGNKVSLALLSDGAYRAHFTADERRLIDRYVPWTRLVRPGLTDWEGAQVEMADLTLSHQHELVLKPAAGYGGQGVIAGWGVSAEEWRAAIEQALQGPARTILQRRVLPVTEPMPYLTADGVRLEEVVLNWGIFVASGRYNGAIIRGLPARGHTVINVTQGAAIGCVFTACEEEER